VVQAVDVDNGGSLSSLLNHGRMLFIKPSSLGDIVHALPVVSAIKTRWPGVHLTWVVKRRWADIVDRVEGVDRVWRVDETAGSWVGEACRMRAERFDVAVDLQGLFRSGALARLCGAPVRVGFANGREGSPWFYTRRVPVPNLDMHAVDRYLLVAESLGARAQGAPKFRFRILDADMETVRNVFHRKGESIDRPWVAMNVSARWPTKRWSLGSFAEVLDRLHQEGLGPMAVIGGPEDRSDAEQLRAIAKRPFIDLTGAVPLGCLPALLSTASLLVTNDSGPMHIAAAVGVPVVAMFGPTSEIRTGPYGADHHVLAGPVSCRPCFSRVCRHDPERECLNLVTPNDVAGAVRRLLAARTMSS
jgi:lipopolysaccharide heptosyltransferase II